MFGYKDKAVIKEIKVTSILKAKAIFNTLFLFNRSFWGIFKVPNINIYSIRVLKLR